MRMKYNILLTKAIVRSSILRRLTYFRRSLRRLDCFASRLLDVYRRRRSACCSGSSIRRLSALSFVSPRRGHLRLIASCIAACTCGAARVSGSRVAAAAFDHCIATSEQFLFADQHHDHLDDLADELRRILERADLLDARAVHFALPVLDLCFHV